MADTVCVQHVLAGTKAPAWQYICTYSTVSVVRRFFNDVCFHFVHSFICSLSESPLRPVSRILVNFGKYFHLHFICLCSGDKFHLFTEDFREIISLTLYVFFRETVLKEVGENGLNRGRMDSHTDVIDQLKSCIKFNF